MNLASVILYTLFTMDCLIFVLSYSESKSWIRHARSSSLSEEDDCPDCLAEVAQNDSPATFSSWSSAGVGLSDDDDDDSNNDDDDNSKRPRPKGRHQSHHRQEGGGRRARANCLADREERRRQANLTKSAEYIPECRKDGTYAAVQCHPSTKSCWCVTRGGRPISGSAVLSMGPTKARPKCSKFLNRGKSETKRRSNHGRVNRNTCNYADRSQFNVALIRTFRSEYNRLRSLTSSYFDTSDTTSDDTVLSWKFDHLDKNKDTLLHRNETLILKHLVKQQIQPRACAKTFISFCAKGDQKITRKEWIECLRTSSVDNLPFDTFNSLVDSGSSPGMHPSQLLKPGSLLNSGGEEFMGLTSGGSGSDGEEVSNCWTERQSVLASQIRNETGIIPECMVNGLYHKVQCAQGKTICWCVEEESGIQIPKTAMFNAVPDCNNRYSKSMKGCSGQKKHKFLTDLLDSLTQRMTTSINEGRRRLLGDTRGMGLEEQSARWYYIELDSNNNGILERNEWKVIRTECSMDKRLKKCGKKLPRHCDVNQDKRISMTEWLDCLGVKFLNNKPQPSTNKRPVNRSNGPRTGKNPFTTILKQ